MPGEISVVSQISVIIESLAALAVSQIATGLGLRQIQRPIQWEGSIYSARVSAFLGADGYNLYVRTLEEVPLHLAGGRVGIHDSNILILGGSIASTPSLLPSNPAKIEKVTAETPRILGGNGGAFFGTAVFGSANGGVGTFTSFTSGFAIGRFIDTVTPTNLGVNGSLSLALGLAVPYNSPSNFPRQ